MIQDELVSGASVLFGLGTTEIIREPVSMPSSEPVRTEEPYQVRSPRSKTRHRISEKCLDSPYLKQPFKLKPIPPVVKVKTMKSRSMPLSARRFEVPSPQFRRYKTFEAQDFGYVDRKRTMDKQRQDFFNELKANFVYNRRQEADPYKVDQNYVRNQSLKKSEITKKEREEIDIRERQSRLIECREAMKEDLKRKSRSSYNDELYHSQCTFLRLIPVTDRLNTTETSFVHI